MNFKLLDCTLRDGGYYTNWDFENNIVNTYIEATNTLPIDYLEIGYRNNPSKEYIGRFGYSPVSTLKYIHEKSNKKLAIMLNEKSTKPTELYKLLRPIQGIINMVRIAVNPCHFKRAIMLAKAIKSLGFEVCFNIMYMSKWKDDSRLISELDQTNDIIDLFCMVDSFGGVTPNDIQYIYSLVKKQIICPIGFHGHNNLQLAFINTLTAISCGVDFVDVTILGMGRGAGNLNTELLLTYLNKTEGLDINFNALGNVINAFQPLHDKYKWGTNLPYMISGVNSIPQKDVMEWCMNRTYSLNNIVRALNNRLSTVEDNAHYKEFVGDSIHEVLIIGGGNTPMEHLSAIKEYLRNNPNIAVIFATSRYVSSYNDLPNEKYYCLVGNEAERLTKNLQNLHFKGSCILPPYPREMGTEVPDFVKEYTYELPSIDFIDSYKDSCTVIALQVALSLQASVVDIVGYDGYRKGFLSEKEVELSRENQIIFTYFTKQNIQLRSFTPTLYSEIKVESIYQYL